VKDAKEALKHPSLKEDLAAKGFHFYLTPNPTKGIPQFPTKFTGRRVELCPKTAKKERFLQN
jgi:hypothetical protein